MFKAIKSPKFLVLLIVFLSWSLPSFCQRTMNFTAFTTKNGLSSNTINAIVKDRFGLMWFATTDGLNRFDGTTFTVYRHRDGDSTSLTSNEILSLYQDRRGTLWVGTSGSLLYYDRKLDQFHRYQGDSFWRNAKAEAIRAIYQDDMGRLWVSSYSGLRVIDLNTNKTTTFILNSIYGDNKNLIVATCFYEDRKSRFWIGTNQGLLLYHRDNGRFTRYSHDAKDENSLSANNVRAITEDSLSNIWIATINGLNLMQSEDGKFKHYLTEKKESLLQQSVIHTICANGKDLWIGTEQGIFILNVVTSKITQIEPEVRNIFSLSDKAIESLFIDKGGICWIGTYRGGISKYDKNLALLNSRLYDPFDPFGLKAPAVTSFAQYDKYKYFIGTDKGGLQLFDLGSGLCTNYPLRATDGVSGKLSIQVLKRSHDGKLWIGTFQQGLFVLDPSTGATVHYEAGKGKKGISENDVFALEEDAKGRMWVGTNGGGVDIFDPQKKEFLNYSELLPTLKKGYVNNFIRCIARGNGNLMWVGTFGGGIVVCNLANGAVSLYNGPEVNLPNGVIFSILKDTTGRMWIGTNGGGISLFLPQKQRFVSYSEKEGLSNGVVHHILQDRNGLLWISTNKGINSFDPKSKKINTYLQQNGVVNSPFINGAGFKSDDGTLFFGSEEGFNYFDPLELPHYKATPEVMLTELKVANNTVVPGKTAPIQEQIAMAKEINLTYGQNFSIGFVALNYTNPHQDKFSYKLEGFDKEWNYVYQNNTAYYTNLDPGTYTFMVRASNGQGVWSKKPTFVRINVLPPWWRTWYAYCLYLVIAGAILFYSRRRSFVKIKRQLEAEEEKREVKRLHELDLMKINFLTNLSHEFRTPISLIMAPVDKLSSMKTDEVISSEVKMISRNARRLLNLVNQLLDFRKMEEQELKLNSRKGDIVSFIRDAVNAFEDLSERKKIDLEFKTEVAVLDTCFDHDKIERVIFNLLSNAFKFTDAGGSIIVSLSVLSQEHNPESGEQELKITVTDTGMGIPLHNQDRIFQRFYQAEASGNVLNQGSGIGLSITREFVSLHKGTISVESQEGVGTTFSILLPLDAADNKAAKSNGSYAENSGINTVALPEAQSDTLETERQTILLVEDNEDLRYYLKENLKLNYKVYEAVNGKEGWQKALSCHPDLIVSDISMPIMSGIELCRKLKSDKRTSFIPVILLTALTGEEDQVRGLETGANDYLTKPFNFQILNAKVRNLIGLNQRLKNTYSKQIQIIAPEIQIESADEKFLSNVAQLVEERLNDANFSIEELSRNLGMSRSSLYNKVFELTGLAPVEYVRSIKLQKAAVLIEKSQYTIREIAFMTGFATPGYFSKLFKAKYDLSPSEYLNLKRGKESEPTILSKG